MTETSKTVGSPTEPAFRLHGGNGLHAMGDEVTSVIPYHSIQGTIEGPLEFREHARRQRS